MDKTVKQFRKRNAILAYLRETTEHPSAEMVYNHLKPEYPDLSLSQLSAIAVPQVSKSGLSHRLKKIMELGSSLLHKDG